MHKGRLEAFSDGVFAIIITIMVLELKVPQTGRLVDVRPMLPMLLCYVLSYVYVGIYWNNHHHLLHATERVSGKVLWANLHLLFWLSLAPFATEWVGEKPWDTAPAVFYGIMLLCAAVAYWILTRSLLGLHGKESSIARAIGNDRKGRTSIVIYIAAAVAAVWSPVLAYAGYLAVALLWLLPDSRIERRGIQEA